MTSTNASFGGNNSGVQAAVINGDFTAHIQQSESLDQACLRDLRTTDPSHDKERIQDTNGGLLKDSYRWILENEEFKAWQGNNSSRLLWIKGDPGKGKTMLMCGIIDELTNFQSTENSADFSSIAFFFCQATDGRINNATAVLRGLVYSLVQKQPSLLSHVRTQYDQAGKDLFEDRNAWNALSMILKSTLKDPVLRHTCMVIDALDECTTGLDALLDLILSFTESTHYSHVRWIVSSRTWPEIEERLDATTREISSISLEANAGSVSEAVNKFIHMKVNHLAKSKKYSDETRDAISRDLSLKSQDTFLWVALVCQSLEKTPKRNALKKLEVFPPGLDALYYRMLDQIRNSEDAEICIQILAVMSTVYRPLSLDEMASLIDLPDFDASDTEALPEIIADCGSFVTLREGIVTLVHQSAKEFLLGNARHKVFHQSKEVEHYAIFSRCLQVMFKTLRRDILGLLWPGIRIEDLKLLPVPQNSNLLAGLHYACVYWVDHLQDSWDESHDTNREYRVDDFLGQKFLNWLEALSLLNSVPHGIMAMLKLETLFQGQPQFFLNRVRDASRFIRWHRTVIETAPLQTYSSALIFSPRRSITKMTYEEDKPSWVLNEPFTEDYWSSCLQTLEGHANQIDSVSWSPDQTRLASGASDATLKIWNAHTGLCESTFDMDCFGACAVRSLAWSPDGMRIALSLDIGSIKIWDLSTGQCEPVFEDPGFLPGSILWLQDGRLVSGSLDRTIKVWDSTSGRRIATLRGHKGTVMSTAWSEYKSRLASGSTDHTIRIWDLDTSQCESILEAHSGSIYSISWISDRNQLASGSRDGTIKIWSLESGQCESILVGHNGPVNSVAWAHETSQLASGSDDCTIKIWNLDTGQCESTLEGHSGAVWSIDWAPDGGRLVSGSDDTTIRIWAPSSGLKRSSREGHQDKVMRISWSQDGLKLASTSTDGTIKIWNPATGNCDSDLSPEGEYGSVESFLWPKDGSRLASIHSPGSALIWNLASGECELVIERHTITSILRPISWSPDGNLIASVADNITIGIWDMDTGQCGPGLILEGHVDAIDSITWSRDGSRLVSSAYNDDFKKILQVWNTVTGDRVINLKRFFHYSSIWSMSSYQNRLAFFSDDLNIEIWNMTTGDCELILKGHTGEIKSIAWSQDGRFLVSSSADGSMKVWDLTTGHCQSSCNVGHAVNVFGFDEADPNQLHTNSGTFNLQSLELHPEGGILNTTLTGSEAFLLPCASVDQGLYKHYTLLNNSWICYDRCNHLWLPIEYRPTNNFTSVLKRRDSTLTLAIGCASGRVIFFVLQEPGPKYPGLQDS